ncbi:TerB family tellurite resistance protein [Chenggangzhangella methanolivorans]|uniref:TerB family tellurite resistance protein n=1 Tax=Chenggangzhangella methanolivorans TaxID=1437009 RepID=A0A9E6R8K5_9HYPH|nr:TerB family tellurite resistance protein [Chenggangzhangella methanolivorans]QZO00044.1 TerB family tellurite resistance protein [Chenggangzhangella methanolivorans]
MPIIATILSGLFFWGVYWFIFMDGHKAVGGMLTGRRNAKRRAAALDAEARAPITLIADPRDAATVLMYLVARQKGDYSAAQLSAIGAEMRGVLSLEGDLAERQSYARFACTKTPSVTAAIQDVAPLPSDRLTPEERDDLFAMVDRIANVDGPPSDEQAASLAALRKALEPAEATGQGFGWTRARA